MRRVLRSKKDGSDLARPQMQQDLHQRKMGMGVPMHREPSNMEMGGQRPQTPGGSMDNAPSPKRQKLDDGGFNGPAGMQPGNRPMPNSQMGGAMMNNGMGDGPNSFAGPNGQPKPEV
jgi:hypothetical protein